MSLSRIARAACARAASRQPDVLTHGDPRPGLELGWNTASPPSAARSCQRSVRRAVAAVSSSGARGYRGRDVAKDGECDCLRGVRHGVAVVPPHDGAG